MAYCNANGLLQLKVLLDIPKNRKWHASESECKSIMSAITHFSESINLSPNHISGIGCPDDVIFLKNHHPRTGHRTKRRQLIL